MKVLSFILLMTFGIFYSQKLKSYSFENLPDKVEKSILIYMKTDWCSICKIQKYQVEKDLELVNLLNDKVYFVIFNPEKYKKPIAFFGENYDYIPNGNSGIHKLSIEFSSNKKPAYPTWVLLNNEGEILFRQEGILDTETLKSLISTSTSLSVTNES